MNAKLKPIPPPLSIEVPPGIRDRYVEAVNAVAKRLRLPVHEARRVVEQTALKRGLESLEAEERARGVQA